LVGETVPPVAGEPGVAWVKLAGELAAESVIRFSWLERGEFAGLEGSEFRVSFPASLEENTKAVFWADLKKSVESRLKKVLGKRIEFVCEFSSGMADGGAPWEEKEVAVVPVAPPVAAEPKGDPMAEFRNDPLIRKAIEVFRAEIETPAS
jgi:hypothetical protein